MLGPGFRVAHGRPAEPRRDRRRQATEPLPPEAFQHGSYTLDAPFVAHPPYDSSRRFLRTILPVAPKLMPRTARAYVSTLGSAAPSMSGRSTRTKTFEFQSTVDQGMSIRVMRYEAMAFGGLRGAKQLDPDGELRLLSVVIYSGEGRWTAPGGAARVVVDGAGEAGPPRPRRYLLLDTHSRAQDDAAKSKSSPRPCG